MLRGNNALGSSTQDASDKTTNRDGEDDLADESHKVEPICGSPNPCSGELERYRTVSVIVVLIAGYAPRFAVFKRNLHDPGFVGATIVEPRRRHAPEVTRHVFFPLEGVVTIEANDADFFTANDVFFKVKPGITRTSVPVGD